MKYFNRYFLLLVFFIVGGCSRDSSPPTTTENTPPPVTASPDKPSTVSAGTKLQTTSPFAIEEGTKLQTTFPLAVEEGTKLQTLPLAVSAGTKLQTTPPIETTEPLTTHPPISLHPDRLAPDESNEVCGFPKILKQAVENRLNKPCHFIALNALSQIKELDVSHTDISDLGPQISYLKNLETLNISHTKIKNLGPEICQLQNLKTLKASHNKYEGNEMPIAIVCLSALQNLDLSDSSLQYIDEYIWYLKNLKNLNLSGNKLTSTPMLFGLMSSLVTLDLRDNLFEYSWMNSLSDCSHFKENSKERKECQEELLETVKCEYWYELPEDCSQLEDDPEQKAKCEKAKFKRGQLGNQSFIKRYEEMTGEEHVEKEDDLTATRCYFYWINHYVLFGNPDDPMQDIETDPKKLAQKQAYLLDLTINGKTLRELRLAQDELVKAGGYGRCHFYAKGVSFRDTEEVWSENMDTSPLQSIPWFSRLIYHSVTDFGLSLWRGLIMPRDTSYGPSTHEIYPERHRSPHWNQRPRKRQYKEDTEAFCQPIDFNTPIPSGPLGPWSKALPAVQTLIEEKYLESGWDECENWPTGVCHDWEERLEKGQNPGGFLFR